MMGGRFHSFFYGPTPAAAQSIQGARANRLALAARAIAQFIHRINGGKLVESDKRGPPANDRQYFDRQYFMTRAIALCVCFSLLVMSRAANAQGELTPQQVKTSIKQGVDFLKRRQDPKGYWTTQFDSQQPGGGTALAALAMLNCGVSVSDPSVVKALKFLESEPEPKATYAAALQIMALCAADPARYKPRIQKLALWLKQRQVLDGPTKGGWSYYDRPGRADNSNAQFAVLALHEAERAGVIIDDQTWRLALNYWLQNGTRLADGSWTYTGEQGASGSMTCAGIASVIIAQDRLSTGDALVKNGEIQCCGAQEPDDVVRQGLAWLGKKFTVSSNPNTLGFRGIGGNYPWHLYYIYGVERVGRMTGRRFIGDHDWYREGCEFLVDKQDKLDHSWIGGLGENDPIVGTAFALLFLGKGQRPVVISKLEHQSDPANPQDWNLHRRALQHLTMRIEQKWKRDLSWQTIDIRAADVSDLLETPILFVSGAKGLKLVKDQPQKIKQYVQQGGFLFVESCNGDGCNGEQFDRDFRSLMGELFPESKLRRLPPDHAVWSAQEKVIPGHLPGGDFWLWGLDTCCRTSVIYCPRSLSCRWELGHPYRESTLPPGIKNEIAACLAIGVNVATYATNRELKDKLDRPQVAVNINQGKPPRGALLIPKISHGGGADDAPSALNNLLAVFDKQLAMKVDFEKRILAPDDPKLLDYPVAFMHGRRAFEFTAPQRQALKNYLDRGGFILADAICASEPFADSMRAELHALYPTAKFARLPVDRTNTAKCHPLFTEDFHGFDIRTVTLRDPQTRDEGDPLKAKLTPTTPFLEALELEGRIVVVLSPYDLSCALEKGTSPECKGYTKEDAARIAANVILFGLQQ